MSRYVTKLHFLHSLLQTETAGKWVGNESNNITLFWGVIFTVTIKLSLKNSENNCRYKVQVYPEVLTGKGTFTFEGLPHMPVTMFWRQAEGQISYGTIMKLWSFRKVNILSYQWVLTAAATMYSNLEEPALYTCSSFFKNAGKDTDRSSIIMAQLQCFAFYKKKY